MSDQVKLPECNLAEYLQKLVKLVPTEIVVLYAAALAFMPANLTAQLIIIGVCAVLTPLYLLFTLKVKNISQVVLSTVSFLVYTFAAGGAIATAPWYQSWLPGLVLMLYTFVVPMFMKPTEIAPTTSKRTTAAKNKSWREI